MKKQKHNNHGYSFVEIIIVMAIMVILTALSLVTWRSVDSAKYKKSVTTLESEFSTLRTTTMAQDSKMAMRLYQGADGAYYIERGYYAAGSFHLPDSGMSPELANSNYYDYVGVSNPVKVLERGTIYYEPAGSAVAHEIYSTGIVIRFNKSDGSAVVDYGAGEFWLYRKNGELIANVHLPAETGVFYETYSELD